MPQPSVTPAATDPSPAGEGGRRAAPDGWGRPGSVYATGRARSLRKRLTPQEVKLWNWLRESIRPIGYHPRRQVPIGPYIVDFAFLKQRVIVEIDGGQHGLQHMQAKDRRRDSFLMGEGFRVLRFWNHDIDRAKPMVMDTIHAALAATPPGASRHPPRGGGINAG